MKLKIRKNSKPYKILKYALAAGGFLLLSSVAPAGGARFVNDLVKLYFRKKRFEREKFLKDLKHLQSRKLIDYRELPNGDITMALTKAGKKLELRYNLDTITLDAKKPWNGEWHMVVFDIPETKRQARDALREKMKGLGFYLIQESVLLTPYPCEQEIDFIASLFDVRDHVLIFTIRRFEGEEKLRHHFGI